VKESRATAGIPYHQRIRGYDVGCEMDAAGLKIAIASPCGDGPAAHAGAEELLA
jgi:hypothetical protein